MQHNDGLMEAVENQRHWGVMWGPPMLPGLDWPAWSDAAGQPIQLLRPPTVDGQGGWYVVRSQSTDEEGWLYGTNFDRLHQPRPGGRASKRVNDQVRSRVWRRLHTDKELQPVHMEQLAVAASQVEGRRVSHKGGAEDPLPPARNLMEQATAGGAKLVSAVAGSSLFKQLPKPSVFKLWQMLMELWNDSARRHGVLKVAPLDPVGLFLAMKAHTAAARDYRCNALRAGKLILAGIYITPAIASNSFTQLGSPGSKGSPQQPNWEQLDSGAAGMVASGPVVGLMQQLPAAAHADHKAGQRTHHSVPGQQQGQSRQVSAVTLTHVHSTSRQTAPVAGPSSSQPNLMRGSTDGSSLVAEPHVPLHGRFARSSQPIAAPSAARHPAASSMSVDVASVQGAAQARQQAGDAVRQTQANPGAAGSSHATKGASGHSYTPTAGARSSRTTIAAEGSSSNPSSWSWQWWNNGQAGAQETGRSVATTAEPAAHSRQMQPGDTSLRDHADGPASGKGDVPSHPYLQGILPDVADAGALVQELMRIVNYTRAAYGYVMAAGHMANISSFLTMVGTSAFFNPVSGASAEANNEAIFTLTGIPQSDILLAEWRNTVFRPCHFLAVDRAQKRLVLCVRGSLELGDICTDLAAMPVDCTFGGGLGACHVHHGLISAALYVQQSMSVALLEAAHSFPDWPLLITGHSLGAGVASLLAIIHKYGHGPEAKPSVWADRVFCVGVACPPAVSPHVADACRDFIVTLVNHMDFVPRLSHYSVELALMDMVKSSPMTQLADNLSSTLSMVTQSLPWTGNTNAADNGSSRAAGAEGAAAGSDARAVSGAPLMELHGRDRSQSLAQTPVVGRHGCSSSDGGGLPGRHTHSSSLDMQEASTQVEIEMMPQRNPYTAALQLGRLRRTASDIALSAAGVAAGLETRSSSDAVAAAGSQAVYSKSDPAMARLSGSFADVQTAFLKLWFGGADMGDGQLSGVQPAAPDHISADQDMASVQHTGSSDAQHGQPSTTLTSEVPRQPPKDGTQTETPARSRSQVQAGADLLLGAAGEQADGCWSGIVEVVKSEAQAAVQAVQALPASLDASLHSTLDAVTAVGRKAVEAPGATSNRSPNATASAPVTLQPSAARLQVPPMAATVHSQTAQGKTAEGMQQQAMSSVAPDEKMAPPVQGQQPSVTPGQPATTLAEGQEAHPLHPATPDTGSLQAGTGQPMSLSAVMDQVTESLEAAVTDKQRQEQGSTGGSQPVNVASLSKKEVAERLAPTKLYLPGRILWVMVESENAVRDVLAEQQQRGQQAQDVQHEKHQREKAQRGRQRVAGQQDELQPIKRARNDQPQGKQPGGVGQPTAASHNNEGASNTTKTALQLAHQRDGGVAGDASEAGKQHATRLWQVPAASTHHAHSIQSHPVAIAAESGMLTAAPATHVSTTASGIGTAIMPAGRVADAGTAGSTATAAALAPEGALSSRGSCPLPSAELHSHTKLQDVPSAIHRVSEPQSFSINTQSVLSAEQQEGNAPTSPPLSLSVRGIAQSFKQLKSTVENVISKATTLTAGATSQAGEGAAVVQKSLLTALSPSSKREQQGPQQALCLLEVEKELFEELSLVASCAGDHIPDSYFAALSQLHASLLAGSAFGHAVHTDRAPQFTGHLVSPEDVPGETAAHASPREVVQSLQVAGAATNQAAASKASLPLGRVPATGVGPGSVSGPAAGSQTSPPSKPRSSLADLLRLS